jgi:ABC-type uncharacterized transport system involved in gliding motility auxiliary subunit
LEINRRQRRRLRVQDGVFVLLLVLIIGLLGWLGQRYSVEFDLTASNRNSLSQASRELLDKMTGPVRIDAYARELEFSPTRRQISDLVHLYQARKGDIQLKFINPDSNPQQVRDQGISMEGELVVHYHGRQQHLTDISEQALSNTLLRLMRTGDKPVYFLTGHGERHRQGHNNQDLGLFTTKLSKAGFRLHDWNLTEQHKLPGDATLLVIASPQRDYLPGEVKLLQKYIEDGGNLLWLMEPGGLRGLGDLASRLGMEQVPGTIADPSGELLGLNNAAFTLISDYPDHPVTRDLDSVTLLPLASALESAEGTDWQVTPLLTTSSDSWSETGKLSRLIHYDAEEDIAGPLVVAYALDRHPGDEVSSGDTAPPEQRVVVMGDGDFLSNAYLGNGANLNLGTALFNWLSHEDDVLPIQTRSTKDIRLDLGQSELRLMGVVFTILIPLGLLGSGVGIWLLRRRR